MNKRKGKLLSRVSIYLLILGFFLLYQLLMAPGEWQFMNNNMFIPAVCLILFYMSLPAIYFRVENKKALNRPVIYLLIFSFLIIYSFVPRQIVLAASTWCETGVCHTTYSGCNTACISGEGTCIECNTCYNTQNNFNHRGCEQMNGNCQFGGCTGGGGYCATGAACNGGACSSAIFCSDTDHCNSAVYYTGYKCNGGGNCNVHNGIINADQNSAACQSCASDQTAGDEGIKYLVNGVDANYDTGLAYNCCGDDAGEYYRCYYTNSGGTPSGPDCFRQSCCNSANSCVAQSPANTCYLGNAGNYYLSGAYHCCEKYWYTCNQVSLLGTDTPCGRCCAGNTNANAAWTTSSLTELEYGCSDTYDNNCDGNVDKDDPTCCPYLDGVPTTAGCNCWGCGSGGTEWHVGNEASNCYNNKWLIIDADDVIDDRLDIANVWMQGPDSANKFVYVMIQTVGNVLPTNIRVYVNGGAGACYTISNGGNALNFDCRALVGDVNDVGRFVANDDYLELALPTNQICGDCCGGTGECTGKTYVQVTSELGGSNYDNAPDTGTNSFNLSCGGPESPIPEFLFGAITAFVILMFILGLARRQRMDYGN